MSWFDSCDLEYALADLKDENERLQAENAELRKELAVNEPIFETLNAANDGLLAENAKLREQNRYLMKGDLLHVLTDQELAEQQRREREMQASIKALDAENEKLQDENERLRSCLSDSAENSKQIMHEAHVQEEENAKLRELVRVFYHCTTSGVCDECPVNGGGAVHLMPDTICDTMHDRMRELGFEVEQ